MNEESPIDDHQALRWLDRLADGELDEESRCLLFEWLDSDPARWRRCSLALLESRELQSALGDWVTQASSSKGGDKPGILNDRARLCSKEMQSPHPEPLSPQSRGEGTTSTISLGHLVNEATPSPISVSSCRSAERSRLAIRSVMALAVVIAFSLGVVTDRHWKADARLVDGVAKPKYESSVDDRISKNNESMQGDSQTISTDDSHKTAGNSKTQDADDLTDPPNLVSSELAAIPDYVRGQFERCGYHVDSKHKVISITLSDGQQMAIPVEEWQFQYAGSQVY